MHFNMDQLEAESHVPWDFSVKFLDGYETVTREPTPEERKMLASTESLRGQEAAAFLSAVFQIPPDEIEKRNTIELRTAYTGYMAYFWQLEKKRSDRAIDAAAEMVKRAYEAEQK